MSGAGTDYTLTATLGLYKPIANMAVGLWGDLLNTNADAIDAAIHFASGGGPYLPLAGNSTVFGPTTFTGNLNYTATGGTSSRAAQDRAKEHVSALDFGIICDGVTDQGAALNTVLAGLAPGTTLYIPGSIYTTQTIVVNLVRLAMPVNSMMRPSGGPTLMVGTCAIIGSSTVSPVVQVTGVEAGLTDVWIGRNGTPAAGSIGLLATGADQIFTRVRSYNHARCIQVGAPQSAPIGGLWSAITTRFDHCMTWNCTENYVYLVNAPETTFYDHRWGINGATNPPGATSYVTFDGDNNTNTGAGTTNTVNFIRCQFNDNGGVAYSLRFYNYNSPDGGVFLTNCYAGGALNAFLYVDPGCTLVQDVKIIGCTINPMASTQTFISDPAKRLTHLKVIGNRIGGGVAQPAAAFAVSGIPATVIGNSFAGAFTAQFDNMTGGVISGNTVNTLSFTGTFTGPAVASGNNYTTIVQTATGPIDYVEPLGNFGSQLTLGKTGASGRVDLHRGTDGALGAFMGFGTAASGTFLDITNVSGSGLVRMNAGSGGSDIFLVNGVEVGRFDLNGIGAAKVTAAAVAPGAGFARLAFVTGTTGGTAKLVAYAGTSTTPVTVMDNIGAGF